MKVLNVVEGAGWTGGVEQAWLLAVEMARLGVEAEMALHRDNPAVGESRRSGLKVHLYEEEGDGRLRRVRRLRALLRCEEYDIAVGHKPRALQDLVISSRTLGRRPLCVGVRRVSYGLPRLSTYRFPDHVVCVSSSVREVVLHGGIAPGRASVIPSGVDVKRFGPDESLREQERRRQGWEGRRVILNLAKYVPAQKGQEILFDALAAFPENERPLLILAGLRTDGEEARAAVAARGLDGDVELLGFRRDIPELLNAADIFVFPSLPGLDAVAGSLLQAMACRRVSVASDVGGIHEYLRDGENGFLVPPGDAHVLRAALRRALDLDDGERARLGCAAAATVDAGYTVEAMARSYRDLFEDLLRRGK